MAKSPDAFRTISEVADWLGIQAHVLRFWESKFTQVKPIKRAGGRRYYRPADMLLLGGIKRLLHDDGLTIKGVQKILREEGMSHVADLSGPLDELTLSQLGPVDAAPAVTPLPEPEIEEKGVVLDFRATAPEPPAPESSAEPEPITAPEDVAAPVDEMMQDPASAGEEMPDAVDTDAAPMAADEGEDTPYSGAEVEASSPDLVSELETMETVDETETETTDAAVSDSETIGQSLGRAERTAAETTSEAGDEAAEATPVQTTDQAPSEADQPQASEQTAEPTALPAFLRRPLGDASPQMPPVSDNTPPAMEVSSHDKPEDTKPEIAAAPEPQVASYDQDEAEPQTEPKQTEPEQAEPERQPEPEQQAEPVKPIQEPEPIQQSEPAAPPAPKPRVIDTPAVPSDSEIAAAPSLLSAAFRARGFSARQAAEIAPALAKFAALRDSMAATRKGGAPADRKD